MNNIKVIVLAGEGESTVLMVNGIKNDCHIEKVIIESNVSKKTLLLNRVKKLGLTKVIGQILFMIYNKVWLRKKSQMRIDEIKNGKNLNDKTIDESMIIRVNSVNSQEVKDILKKYRPNIVIVNGTRIIKKDIIEIINAPFINTHVGITPKYRGVHGGYWALVNNDFEHCGATIHLIDAGIDTGGILHQDIIKITNKDNFNTYPYLQIAVAIPLMKQSIVDISNKTYKIQKTDLPSKLWSHPTIIEYLKYRIFHKVK